MKLYSLFLIVFFICTQKIWGNDFVWYNGKKPITYSVTEDIAPVVAVALDMFVDDMKQVTGYLPQKTIVNDAKVRIVQLNKNNLSAKERKELLALGVPVDTIAAKKDAFFISVLGKGIKKQLYIVGSDGRGTAYGILELSRKAGVSPWVWWGDVVPERKSILSFPENYSTFQSPSVEYRGIFLNDEDWALQPWSWKTFEPRGIKGMIGPQTYKEIFKFLLRMRANTIWPAMHSTTTPFYFVPGAKEVADSCGIIIGTSHCEPLMRNNVSEWKVKERGYYNYITNRDSVIAYWTERLREVGNSENIYTIGMRGVHDGSMEGVKTLEEKKVALQRVLDDQRGLLAKYVRPDVTTIPQQFIPYKEVLQIMDNGLKVPDDVILTWCDDNYGYMTRLSDKNDKRSGGAGVYYHLSYWGRPHDYLWLCTTQPGLVYNEMKEAYEHGSQRLWIVNVHDLKPAAYDLELFLDMAWDINSVSSSTLNEHHERWLCREFGEQAGKKLLPAMLDFYRLCAIRRPEFMGWSQEEAPGYVKGRMPTRDSEFSLTEFGSELDRYLQDYESVKRTLDEAETLIPEYRKDAFYGQVKYAVFSASAMAVKFLEAQRARTIAAGIQDSAQWKNNVELMVACAKSMNAYNEILRLTDYYNNSMSGGKWKNSMCHNPRNLFVFDPPKLPLNPTNEDIREYVSFQRKQVLPLKNLTLERCIADNACNYSEASSSNVKEVEALGHSMNVVSLPKGESITFVFDSPWEGEAVLRTAVVPTQPSDRGDIRFSVSIDKKEPQVCSFKEGFRTESWKKNVLRGQAIRETRHTLEKGKHTLTITALDNHILIDQWMLDFNLERQFYVFPVEPERYTSSNRN
ncbi:glycosyl hydrolase 115 family protein [Bacteroides ovatus]|uniref:Glycosyl hydrolase family 115 n=1 Tax=Bacteroides ovatus TaxID=28116 RepID=A0A1G8GR76_BACOV|nr:glycosyl hydrolase 115 family protein [Bacteroides ovatus]SDH96771.1 Glycosyl hydrolase family 115 [Bacteroides ovatus]